MSSIDVTQLLLLVPVLLFSFVAHEYAHGYAALRQGDPTGYQLGRLTWNPLKHIDPVMSVLVPLIAWFQAGMIFGGARPMPVQPRNFKHFKRGDIIVSLAGVAANLAIALGCTLLIALLGLVGRHSPTDPETLRLLQRMMIYGVELNCLLFIFNLLPIPPLDGSHVFKYLLPMRWSVRYQSVGAFGFFIVFMVASVTSRFWGPLVFGLMRGFLTPVRAFLLPGAWPS